MRWTPSLFIALAVSLGLIALGMWLLFMGTDGAAIAAAGQASGGETAVQAPPPQGANPAAMGLALLIGGVLVGFMAFRRV